MLTGIGDTASKPSPLRHRPGPRDLKNSALAHLPRAASTTAAWLVLAVLAFMLTWTAACLTNIGLVKATISTIHRKPVSVLAGRDRRRRLHLSTQSLRATCLIRACSTAFVHLQHLTDQP